MGLFRQYDDDFFRWRFIIGYTACFEQMDRNSFNLLHHVFFNGCRVDAVRTPSQK